MSLLLNEQVCLGGKHERRTAFTTNESDKAPPPRSDELFGAVTQHCRSGYLSKVQGHTDDCSMSAAPRHARPQMLFVSGLRARGAQSCGRAGLCNAPSWQPRKGGDHGLAGAPQGAAVPSLGATSNPHNTLAPCWTNKQRQRGPCTRSVSQRAWLGLPCATPTGTSICTREWGMQQQQHHDDVLFSSDNRSACMHSFSRHFSCDCRTHVEVVAAGAAAVRAEMVLLLTRMMSCLIGRYRRCAVNVVGTRNLRQRTSATLVVPIDNIVLPVLRDGPGVVYRGIETRIAGTAASCSKQARANLCFG